MYRLLASDLFLIIHADQLNTCVQSSTKATPYELAFGQPPHSTVFPGVSKLVMEEDVEDILLEEGLYMYQSMHDLLAD